MTLFSGAGTSVIALETSGWDAFYSSWLVPVAQCVIVMAVALAVLIAVSGLLTRCVTDRNGEAWGDGSRRAWTFVGGLSVLAVAVLLPVHFMFRPFGDGTWLTWVFLGVAALGTALVLLAPHLQIQRTPRRPTWSGPGLPRPASWILLLVWAGFVSCFFSWGAHSRLLVTYLAMAVLGVTASAMALGQNLRLQIEAQDETGKVDAAASDYVLARLQSLGTTAPDPLGISRATDLSRLLSEDLSAIPAGSVTAAAARVLYAVRPGLTWRARLTVVDVNRVAVTMTRNGRHVESTVISRQSLGLPPLPPTLETPQLEQERSCARAQLLTGAAACVLVRLSRVHPHLRKGLCGAERWRSVALQVIATERALVADPDVRLRLLKSAVEEEPRYGLARLEYLVELFARTPRTTANRLRFARLMDTQQQLAEKDGHTKPGWEVVHMRTLYLQAVMRINSCLVALHEDGDQAEQLLHQDSAVLADAGRWAGKLADACKGTEGCAGFVKHEEENVRHLAEHMKPVADGLVSAVDLLTERARRLAEGTRGWTWTPPVPEDYPSPGLALHYAALAELADEHGVSRPSLGDVRDYLAFFLATAEDRQELQKDPSFWTIVRDPGRRELITGSTHQEPVGMLDLAPFQPYAEKLAQAGITTFRKFRQRTSTDPRQQTLAEYLGVSPLLVSHLVDIATLADTHEDLASPRVVQALLAAGINSRGELRERAATDKEGLTRALTLNAERFGLTALPAFAAPDRWLTTLMS
ncbi:DUF4332 domain-containing protein [Streptomyces sp. SCA3-4]|uniref:DUF4332 domain-containing protein n=1 Tax=Streptomyces sichuanensis TaxID=2871810 RepID=UPI001CE34FD1|nr:DUF4332 domain-containing protein [Streptomyces sichuanensis]MCA6096342.1 DUF4332 domain-containing protein [Streptomyces sichuanensis]